MEEEKQNSLGFRLRNLDEIPEGFAFRRDASWDRLQTRLSASTKRRQRLLAYAAAIVLLLTGIGLYTWRMDKGAEPGVGYQHGPAVIPKGHPDPTSGQASGILKKTKTLSVKEQDQPMVNRSRPEPTLFIRPGQAHTDTSTTVLGPNTATADISPKPVDTGTEASRGTVRPRYRIAHINELGVPPVSAPPLPPVALQGRRPSAYPEEILNTEENLPPRKIRRGFFPAISSSQ